MIILSAFSLFYHIIHLSIYDAEIRFTFCFRYQYVKDRFGPESGSGNPRAWTSVPGRFPSFLLYIFTETRELQHLEAGTPCEPRSTADLRRIESLQKGGVLFTSPFFLQFLQKGGVPAAPSGTATLLRLSPNHQFCLRPILAVTDFRHPRLSWLDGRCVQGPGTYSPRHG